MPLPVPPALLLPLAHPSTPSTQCCSCSAKNCPSTTSTTTTTTGVCQSFAAASTEGARKPPIEEAFLAPSASAILPLPLPHCCSRPSQSPLISNAATAAHQRRIQQKLPNAAALQEFKQMVFYFDHVDQVTLTKYSTFILKFGGRIASQLPIDDAFVGSSVGATTTTTATNRQILPFPTHIVSSRLVVDDSNVVVVAAAAPSTSNSEAAISQRKCVLRPRKPSWTDHNNAISASTTTNTSTNSNSHHHHHHHQTTTNNSQCKHLTASTANLYTPITSNVNSISSCLFVSQPVVAAQSSVNGGDGFASNVVGGRVKNNCNFTSSFGGGGGGASFANSNCCCSSTANNTADTTTAFNDENSLNNNRNSLFNQQQQQQLNGTSTTTTTRRGNISNTKAVENANHFTPHSSSSNHHSVMISPSELREFAQKHGIIIWGKDDLRSCLLAELKRYESAQSGGGGGGGVLLHSRNASGTVAFGRRNNNQSSAVGGGGGGGKALADYLAEERAAQIAISNAASLTASHPAATIANSPSIFSPHHHNHQSVMINGNASGGGAVPFSAISHNHHHQGGGGGGHFLPRNAITNLALFANNNAPSHGNAAAASPSHASSFLPPLSATATTKHNHNHHSKGLSISKGGKHEFLAAGSAALAAVAASRAAALSPNNFPSFDPHSHQRQMMMIQNHNNNNNSTNAMMMNAGYNNNNWNSSASASSYYTFKGPFVLIEDSRQEHKPIFKEYHHHNTSSTSSSSTYNHHHHNNNVVVPVAGQAGIEGVGAVAASNSLCLILPRLNLNSLAFHCPFLPHTSTMNGGVGGAPPPPFPSQPIAPLQTRPSSLRSIVEQRCKRRKSRNAKAKPKAGYCECCFEVYTDMSKHSQTPFHRSFACCEKNYAEIDVVLGVLQRKTLGGGGASSSSLLKSVGEGEELDDQRGISIDQIGSSVDDNDGRKACQNLKQCDLDHQSLEHSKRHTEHSLNDQNANRKTMLMLSTRQRKNKKSLECHNEVESHSFQSPIASSKRSKRPFQEAADDEDDFLRSPCFRKSTCKDFVMQEADLTLLLSLKACEIEGNGKEIVCENVNECSLKATGQSLDHHLHTQSLHHFTASQSANLSTENLQLVKKNSSSSPPTFTSILQPEAAPAAKTTSGKRRDSVAAILSTGTELVGKISNLLHVIGNNEERMDENDGGGQQQQQQQQLNNNFNNENNSNHLYKQAQPQRQRRQATKHK